MNRTEPRSELAIEVYREICKHSGQTTKQIGLALHQPTRCINEALLAIEEDGDLVYEDDHGRLYPFDAHSIEPDKCLWIPLGRTDGDKRLMAWVRKFIHKRFARFAAINGDLILQESDDAVSWTTARNKDIDQDIL